MRIDETAEGLAGGRLFSEDSDAAHRVRWVMGEIGARLGVSMTTLAIAWLLRLPSQPIPVIGSRRLSASDEAAGGARVAST